MNYFDYDGFRNYYLAKSKLPKKQALIQDFWQEWIDKFGTSSSLTYVCGVSVKYISDLWKAPNKKDLKIKLISRGYSDQAIESLFKCFTDWLKATK
ncbi:MAG: hypothetical protein J6C07_11675 [Lachnospiraceae bacterium]|nr:hypothetical protein [Lachnospiraceae bacterium]